ncbi:MAG: hypothetical protein MI924_26375, partial [Chloroflexales bacterium]|nr:hypothetical protein [Chloroflexales bacterium]
MRQTAQDKLFRLRRRGARSSHGIDYAAPSRNLDSSSGIIVCGGLELRSFTAQPYEGMILRTTTAT